MYLSKNFTFDEFFRSETADRLGIDNSTDKALILNNIKDLVYNILQPLRNYLKCPIHINSGYRCIKLNNALGSKPTSQHCLGQAADIRVKGMTPKEVAIAILELGLPYDQLGLYDTFVHVSISDKDRRQIFYDKSYKGTKLQYKEQSLFEF